jgi:mannose-1-phosphate guanylyltransferase/mannose-1-phosphate guanylyltransferase/mannose-6-phosphate isomerase
MDNSMRNVYPILLAGGTGTRLWPVSRQLYPKQLVKFIGQDSLVQSTIKRLIPVLEVENIRIVCGQEHLHQTARHMEEIGIASNGKIIGEPCGRNTAPAILLGVLTILKVENDAILCVFPADHIIKKITDFHAKLQSAIRLADKGSIVTFGIKPHYPETGYGYIEGADPVSEGAMVVKRFVEKPDRETAQKYIKAGNFFWNSGMFAFKASIIIEEFKRYQPGILEHMTEMVQKKNSVTKDDYELLPDISIDYAIMEMTEKGVVLPSDFGWSDIGSWKSLYEFLPKDENNNVIEGDVISKDTRNCLIMGRERLIAANHLDSMVIVETSDSVFVSDLDNSRDVKSIVEKLKASGRKECHQHVTVTYSWGSLTVLEQTKEYSIMKLVVHPGSSTQADPNKLKHLSVVSGLARIQSGKKIHSLQKGESLVIPKKETAKIENPAEEMLSMIQMEI